MVSTIASLQNSMPVQAIVERRQFDGPRLEVDRGQVRDERLDVVLGDAEDDELLVRGQAGAGGAVLLDDVAEPGQGLRR